MRSVNLVLWNYACNCKTSCFYICCKSELSNVPVASCIDLGYLFSFLLKFFIFCFASSMLFSSSHRLAGILLDNGKSSTMKLPRLKYLTQMFCFGVAFIFVLRLYLISSPGFGTKCMTFL